MPAAESRAFDAVLPAVAGEHGRFGGDAADGRAALGVSILWLSPVGGDVTAGRLVGEPQTSQAADAGDGAGDDLPEAEHQPKPS
jgi:hypothetical protein